MASPRESKLAITPKNNGKTMQVIEIAKYCFRMRASYGFSALITCAWSAGLAATVDSAG
jgi:hypothetical protein